MEGTQELETGVNSMSNNIIDVFMAWVFTPTGALLLVLAILFAGMGVVTRILGAGQRFARMFTVCMSIAGILFFFWVVSGLLEVWGLPVREWAAQIFGELPDIGAALSDFFIRLLFTAG